MVHLSVKTLKRKQETVGTNARRTATLGKRTACTHATLTAKPCNTTCGEDRNNYASGL